MVKKDPRTIAHALPAAIAAAMPANPMTTDTTSATRALADSFERRSKIESQAQPWRLAMATAAKELRAALTANGEVRGDE